jgi:two-component system LytT family response regulator
MNITLKCSVIDDEPLARELICSFVKKTPFLELENSYASASEAVRSIIDGKVDLVFLDIQMPELNGIEFAKIIPPECRIVFVTAFEQYAIEGFRHNAIDYLLKPVSYSEFLNAANRALVWAELNEKARLAAEKDDEPQFIIVKSEYKLIQIDISKISYIEGLKDYVKIYTEDSPNCILSLMNMKTIEQRLPADKFIRVHRSFIVQMSKINVIERNRIVFGKKYIPISDTYKKAFNDYLQKHTIVPPRDGGE